MCCFRSLAEQKLFVFPSLQRTRQPADGEETRWWRNENGLVVKTNRLTAKLIECVRKQEVLNNGFQS